MDQIRAFQVYIRIGELWKKLEESRRTGGYKNRGSS